MTYTKGERIELPNKYFFYTFDQIRGFLQVSEITFSRFIHYEGISPGFCPKTMIKAVNLAPTDEEPVWRVSEQAFKNFLRAKGIKFYTRGFV